MPPLARLVLPRLLTWFACAALCGCSASSAFQAIPPRTSEAIAKRANASATLTIRVRSTAASAASVRSVVVELIRSDTGRIAARGIVNVRSGSPSCASLNSALVCRTSMKIGAESYRASVSTYHGYGGSGNPIALHQYEPVDTSSANPVVRLATSGPAVSLRIVPVSANARTLGTRLTVDSPAFATATLLVAPMDRDENRIVGNAVPSIDVASSNPAFFKGRLGVPQSGVVQIALPRAMASASTVLTASARGLSSKESLAFEPFASDDWIGFAHDQMRTAYQPQPTSIVPSNVNRLAVRWKFQNRSKGHFYGSPVAYRGSIVIVDTQGNVLSLSAADGALRWRTALPQSPKQNAYATFAATTPTVDADDGLLFIGTRTFFDYPAPSYFFALRLSDGAIVWRKKLSGILRSAPVYYRGRVFEGTAGGDRPPSGQCLNGGITAMDAKTGAILWTWLVNPWTNPGGGGSVWGAIAFDGSHIIFGTGNPCGAIVPTSQGAVSLNLDGTMAWSFVANDVAGSDNDTGGGVALVGDDALFFSKDGSLYDLNRATGKERWSAGFGSSSGLGGFASPSSNGSVVITGAGIIPVTDDAWRHVEDGTACLITQPWLQPGPKTGFGSAIDAVDRSGRVLWSRKMNYSEVGYVAMTATMAYANLDDSLYALDLGTGRVLWSYRSSANFQPSAAIVPSGLYAADTNDVYAFSPREQTSNP